MMMMADALKFMHLLLGKTSRWTAGPGTMSGPEGFSGLMCDSLVVDKIREHVKRLTLLLNTNRNIWSFVWETLI